MNTLVLNQNQSYLRYELLLPRHEQVSDNQAKSYLSHNQFCPWTRNVVVHSTCKTLLHHPERYGSFAMALHVASGQHARLVKSKQNLASFKMMQNHVLGCYGSLRKQIRQNFSYKWAFLAPGHAASTTTTTTNDNLNVCTDGAIPAASTPLATGYVANTQLGLNNIFIFELDHLDYGLFEFIHGLDLTYLPTLSAGAKIKMGLVQP